MSIGIGGAGSKLSNILDNGKNTIIDVSGVELEKVDASAKIRAVVHSAHGQLKGSRKNPKIGREAFQSIRNKLLQAIQGDTVLCSTGGGTGNGICSELLEHLSENSSISIIDKTTFVLVLPYPEREAADFVENSIDFLEGPLSKAIDAGNTGNIIFVSNRHKFEKRIAEGNYNQLIISSLKQFLAIPEKGEKLEQLDGSIDQEDFTLYKAKPFINHFCQFEYDPEISFGPQLESNYNKLLLKPESTIEALFLLELPDEKQTNKFYNILDYFSNENVSPTYSVLLNPELKKPLITVSILYSRKPVELVNNLNSVSGKIKLERIRKSLEQHVTLSKLEVDMTSEAQKVADETLSDGNEVINILKRIGKL